MVRNISTSSWATFEIDVLPDKCPFCHKSITPNIIEGYHYDQELEVFLSCPDDRCKKSFISYYHYHIGRQYNFRNKTTLGSVENKIFNPVIADFSPLFVKIYNEALCAESQGLLEVCWVWYRKALEFLIKDYAVKNNPEKEEKIKEIKLGAVISDYVNDARIKEVSRRAVWLGNDETHYVRKWEGRDLSDLKKLIDLAIHWIEMEELNSSLLEDMPE